MNTSYGITPKDGYHVAVKHDSDRNRWVAEFTSVGIPDGVVKFAFPLTDVPVAGYDISRDAIPSRPNLSSAEETVLALVFGQMVNNYLEARAFQQAMNRQQASLTAAQEAMVPA